jgi:hypothetical protein
VVVFANGIVQSVVMVVFEQDCCLSWVARFDDIDHLLKKRVLSLFELLEYWIWVIEDEEDKRFVGELVVGCVLGAVFGGSGWVVG